MVTLIATAILFLNMVKTRLTVRMNFEKKQNNTTKNINSQVSKSCQTIDPSIELKKEKDRQKSKKYRDKKKLEETDEQKIRKRQNQNLRKRKSRAKQTKEQRTAEYDAAHVYKSERWLQDPVNREKQREYSMRTRKRNQNERAAAESDEGIDL